MREGKVDALTGAGKLSGQLLVLKSHRLEAENQRLLRELRQRNAELEAFARATAHDLKAPLSTIETVAGLLGQLLSEEGASSACREMAADIEGASARMRRLVNGLLALGRTGRANAVPEAVDLGEVVTAAVAARRREIQERGIRVRVGGLPSVEVVRADIEALVDNLVGNAIRYGSGSPKPAIEVSVVDRDDCAELVIADNGSGFDPAMAERLFEPYVRGSDAGNGTGLGLAIVKRAAASWGGRAWLESKPGCGTRARVTFPAAKRKT